MFSVYFVCNNELYSWGGGGKLLLGSHVENPESHGMEVSRPIFPLFLYVGW